MSILSNTNHNLTVRHITITRSLSQRQITHHRQRSRHDQRHSRRHNVSRRPQTRRISTLTLSHILNHMTRRTPQMARLIRRQITNVSTNTANSTLMLRTITSISAHKTSISTRLTISTIAGHHTNENHNQQRRQLKRAKNHNAHRRTQSTLLTYTAQLTTHTIVTSRRHITIRRHTLRTHMQTRMLTSLLTRMANITPNHRNMRRRPRRNPTTSLPISRISHRLTSQHRRTSRNRTNPRQGNRRRNLLNKLTRRLLTHPQTLIRLRPLITQTLNSTLRPRMSLNPRHLQTNMTTPRTPNSHNRRRRHRHHRRRRRQRMMRILQPRHRPRSMRLTHQRIRRRNLPTVPRRPQRRMMRTRRPPKHNLTRNLRTTNSLIQMSLHHKLMRILQLNRSQHQRQSHRKASLPTSSPQFARHRNHDDDRIGELRTTITTRGVGGPVI